MINKTLTVIKKSKKEIYNTLFDKRVDWFLKNHGNSINISNDEQDRVLEMLTKQYEKNNISNKNVLVNDLDKIDMNEYDLCVVVGGDGTFLNAAKHCTNIPIVGVNSDLRQDSSQTLGSRAYFSYFNKNNLNQDFAKLLNNDIKKVHMDRLKVTLEDMIENVKVTNDLIMNEVYIASPKNLTIGYKIKVKHNGKTILEEKQNSEGYMITTPQQSWGVYNYHAKVLPTGSKQFQGISKSMQNDDHNLMHDVIITKHPCVFEIESLSRESVAYFDGAYNKHNFGFGNQIKVEISDYPLTVIGFNEKKRERYALARSPRIIEIA